MLNFIWSICKRRQCIVSSEGVTHHAKMIMWLVWRNDHSYGWQLCNARSTINESDGVDFDQSLLLKSSCIVEFSFSSHWMSQSKSLKQITHTLTAHSTQIRTINLFRLLAAVLHFHIIFLFEKSFLWPSSSSAKWYVFALFCFLFFFRCFSFFFFCCLSWKNAVGMFWKRVLSEEKKQAT